MAIPTGPTGRPRVDVAQINMIGIRAELYLSEDGGAPVNVPVGAANRLQIIGRLIADGFVLETTGADPRGPETVDTLVRVTR